MVLAQVLSASDRLEAVPGAGTGLTAHKHHLGVVAAHLGPVGDLAGSQGGDLLDAQVGHGVGGVDDDGDTVLSHGDLLDASLAILQITRGEADVAGTFLGTSDAGAGARAGVLDGHAVV